MFRIGKSEADKKLILATDRGTAVHEMLELYIQNIDIDYSKYNKSHIAVFNSMKNTLSKILHYLHLTK